MAADVKQAIVDKWAAYTAATQSRDMAGLMSLWAPDARFLEPGMDLSGGELHTFMREFWEKGGEVFDLKMNTIEVFDHGDYAYEIAQYDETFKFPGGERMTIHNNGFFQWERQPDGDWKLSRVVAGPREGPEEG